MTRVGAMPHRIDLIPRDLTGRNERNNEVRSDEGELADVPARVDILHEAEDIADRDRKTERATVVIPYYWRGQVLDLDSVDAFRFAGNVYELIGQAIKEDDHAGRPDHFELAGLRIVG